MILGDLCTRDCFFCAVKHGTPLPPDPEEPERVAEAVELMGLKYAVITSVTRDDLEDGGASIFAATIQAMKSRTPDIRTEVLVPDFQGNTCALDTVLAAGPDVLNHNIEVPESFYSRINRPTENYRQSLAVLEYASKKDFITKSGLMIGLGETRDDITQAFNDLRDSGCELLTIGQYLQATTSNAPVCKYYSPEEFDLLKADALEKGFKAVVSGPLVRSSFKARDLYFSLKGHC
jgi:lipoic acid synthetase